MLSAQKLFPEILKKLTPNEPTTSKMMIEAQKIMKDLYRLYSAELNTPASMILDSKIFLTSVMCLIYLITLSQFLD